MVSRPLTRSARLARSVAVRVAGQIRRQFITRNRRMAFVLTIATLAIGLAAVHLSEWWFSPGMMILPVLAGGLLLWPRALRILFGLVAIMLLYDGLYDRAGAGIIAVFAGGLLLDPFNAGPRILGLPGGFVVVFSVFVVWFVIGSLSILKVPERAAR